MIECRLEGCNKPAKKKNAVCSMHLARKARHGGYEIVLFDGHSNHYLYPRWRAMIERCTKPYSQAWKHYGGRGIKVCERWLEFNHFLSDMGEPPTSKHTLDRINNDGNYEPGNVRWALRDVQTHNQRSRTSTGYRGVYKFGKKYRASLIRGKKYFYFGTFSTPEKAYKAYKEKEVEIYGD